MTNQDVIAMVKAGLSGDIVAAKVKASKCQCDTSPAALERLKTDGVPDAVVLAMVEVTKPPVPVGITDIRQAKTAYLVNQSTDLKLYNDLATKLEKWGQWKLVERPEDADIILVLAESNVALGSMSTASVSGTGNYASGTGFAVPLMSFKRFLIVLDRASHRQLLAVDHQRTMTATYTASALVNRMRKQVEKLDKRSSP
ncbi:MAG TPA: hypothetical protein VFQ00_07995 [Terriglobales bacterium]|nr:hypothetical protein [Terriglobales bacterium]